MPTHTEEEKDVEDELKDRLKDLFPQIGVHAQVFCRMTLGVLPALLLVLVTSAAGAADLRDVTR